ncbi:DUF6538 domain-containing protein [Roseateles sp. LKC17W]|uniref:DUF6538 domain-containing protein n=1 Tax=Pelomonas margarita TaxID=3299031 RepID=A0ABW7FNT4_9BURK
MAAKTSRLAKNRHGTYCLRWIVPAGMRADGSPREIRFSLRTTDPGEARILALEFNLLLERVRAATRAKQRSAGMKAPLTVTIGETQWNIRDGQGRHQFDQLLRDRPELRQALLATVEDGVAPVEAAAALVQQATPAIMSAAHPANPVLLKTAIELFEQSRPTLNGNRRGTASEKRRTMDLLQVHLIARRRPSQLIYVHDIRRDELIDFVTEYAQRPAKACSDGAASKTKPFAHDANGNDGFETLSPRTVIKAIGHLENFYAYAVGKSWVAANPMDAAFHGATEGLRKGAASAKRSNSYQSFTDAELALIFDPVRYLENMRAADDFWSPLIGAYLGARLAEIVTRQASDIRFSPEHGVYLLSVNDDAGAEGGPRARAKNSNSVRHVPLPQALIDLGLIDYVDHVKALGATALFPHRELNDTRQNDPSKHVSRTFGEHLDSIGITSPDKVFHSFRHTVITRLHVHGTPVGDAELIVGHAAQDAHVRLSSASGQFGGQSSTHLKTYVSAGSYAQGSLHARLKAHQENSLHYPLDFERLREAARIVQALTIKKRDGSFVSGWHTNNRVVGQAMLDRLAATPRNAVNRSAAPQPGLRGHTP